MRWLSFILSLKITMLYSNSVIIVRSQFLINDSGSKGPPGTAIRETMGSTCSFHDDGSCSATRKTKGQDNACQEMYERKIPVTVSGLSVVPKMSPTGFDSPRRLDGQMVEFFASITFS